jgi:hypothetical protein
MAGTPAHPDSASAMQVKCSESKELENWQLKTSFSPAVRRLVLLNNSSLRCQQLLNDSFNDARVAVFLILVIVPE